MTMDPVPNLTDLEWLFETEPEGLPGADWRSIWPYALVHFASQRVGFSIECSLEPGSEELRLRVEREGEQLLALDLQGVASVDVDRTPNAEGLQVAFRHSEYLPLLYVRLKPSLSVVWGSTA